MSRLESFQTGQRVLVHENVNEVKLNGATGVVSRVRSDGGAWIILDARSDIHGVHPFPSDDDRGRNVMAYPDQCEAVKP